MKVLHIVPALPPCIGGVETLVGELTSWQHSDGVEVVIISGTLGAEPRQEIRQGIEIHWLPFIGPLGRSDLAGIVAVKRHIGAVIRDYVPQIIHLHPTGGDMMFMRDAVRATGIPVVVTVHSDIAWMPQVYRNNLGPLLARADAVTTVSQSMLGHVRAVFPDLGDKLHLVENGMAMREARELEPVPGHFFYLGRLSSEKGVDIVLRALALLAARGIRFHLTIAGDGADRAGLEALAQTLALDSQVTFLGPVAREEVPELMARHVALLVPSRWREPFGLVVIEAAMAGLPAIVAATGALVDLVVPGETGLQVTSEEPEEWADAMAQLAGAPEQARSMGKAAQARAAQQWPIGRAGRAYGEIYARLAEAKSPEG